MSPMYDGGEHVLSRGIVGENYLKNFDVVIDFGRMRVDLAPTGLASVLLKLDEGVPEEKGSVPP